MPRVQIAWLMLVVAFVAFDFGAIRGLFGVRDGFAELVGVGALPMANLVGVAAIVVAKGRGPRRFLVGFVAFGSVAMLACLGWAWMSPESLTSGLLRVLVPVADALTANRLGASSAVNYAIAAVLLALPQLAFALLGGGMSCVLGVLVDRRRSRPIDPQSGLAVKTRPRRSARRPPASPGPDRPRG